MPPLDDVFTAAEIARAAGVPRNAILALVESGELKPISPAGYFAWSDAVRAGRLARSRPGSVTPFDRRLPTLASSAVHLVIAAGVIWWTSGVVTTSTTAGDRPRLVFLAGPGPGGGGGGGGRAPVTPQRRIARPQPVVSEAAAPEPPPLPSRTAISAVASTSGEARPQAPQDDGTGQGEGPGIDEGTGGGAGGGPFRPGSGIDPPRLLQEVKAAYTDEARRRGVTGVAVLEIVVRSDGSVGDVRLLRGLGAGLDEQAAAAVRKWRFAPARRLGAPVDVIVEVEIAFSMR